MTHLCQNTGSPLAQISTLPEPMSTYCNGVIMGAMASQIPSLAIVYSSVYRGADQRKHQSSASLAFMSGIHRWPVISPHKGPVTRKMFPFDDVIMIEFESSQKICLNNIPVVFFRLQSKVDKSTHNICFLWKIIFDRVGGIMFAFILVVYE